MAVAAASTMSPVVGRACARHGGGRAVGSRWWCSEPRARGARPLCVLSVTWAPPRQRRRRRQLSMCGPHGSGTGGRQTRARKQTGTNKAGSGQGLSRRRRVRQQSHAAVWGVVLAPSCVARDKEIDDWFAGITPGAAGGGSPALSVSQLCHRRVSQRYRIKRLFPIMCALAMCLVEGGVAYKQLCVSSERNVCLVTGSLRGLGMNMVAHHVLRLRALRSLRRRRGLGRRPGTRPAARGGSRPHGRGVGVS